MDNMNCAFYYEVNLLQILLREGYISETDYHAIVSIAEDDLKATLSFRITIALESGKEYQANVSLDMPIEGVVENGTSSREITDLSDVVFKRIKN